jgi:porin
MPSEGRECCSFQNSPLPPIVLARIFSLGIRKSADNALALAPMLSGSSCPADLTLVQLFMTTKHLKLAVCIGVLLIGKAVLAQEGHDGSNRNSAPAASGTASGTTVASWGPVPTKKKSLVNLEPWLLPFVNNGPVFGIPGTVTGNLWTRTQLTGAWGGARTRLAEHGWFFDAYTTGAYQNVTSGGLKTGSALEQNVQLSVNLDTARAGLWTAGLLHLTVQSRYADSPDNTFSAGSILPQYTGLVFPDPFLSHNIYPSEYYIVQGFSNHVSVVLGKISNIFLPDQTLFGNTYKYDFANFNFLKNPIMSNFFNPTAWVAIGVWRPAKSIAIRGGLVDPDSHADNFAEHVFDRMNLYLTSLISYEIGGLPGQVVPSYDWSNKPKINLESPFTLLPPTRRTQAVGALLGLTPADGLQTNFKDSSWFAITNASQYFWVKDDSADIDDRLKSGQLLHGVGVFGRLGYAPEASNRISRDASVALFAHGVFDSRKYDSVGAGFYYNGISNDLKNAIARLTAGKVAAKNEKGVELFYDLAITPAVRVIPGYQYIWNPLTAEVVARQTRANVFLLRLTLAF